MDGNHVRRGERVHVITLQALFTLYHEAFSQQHPHLTPILEKAAQTLNQAITGLDQSMEGNWVVNKNPDVPFWALGAHHALEHINRTMKVSG